MKFIWWTTLGYLSGMSFRFWRTVYFLRSSMTHLFLTVTCTVSILIAFENLIGVKANQIHWPSPLNMVNRKVRIKVLYFTLHYGTDPSKKVLNHISCLIQLSPKRESSIRMRELAYLTRRKIGVTFGSENGTSDNLWCTDTCGDSE